MINRTIVLIIMLFCAAQAADVSVVITEKTVNDFIAAVGPVSGKGSNKGVKYKWKVKKASFDFEPGSAEFLATVDLDAGIFKFSDKIKSKVNVTFDVEKNKIFMEVEKAIFKIYIKVLGKKIKVGQVDIAKYYKPKFEFNGPQPVQKIIEMETSKSKTRSIAVTTISQELVLEKDQIRVSVDLSYVGTDK
ncbi:MAG: hypothetical protein HQ562_09440 [Candidatus Marinimicrobia bacterium]|nr:hypothetical protein [Candidatus Neomarinimicrobiota bacterium]